MPKHFDLIGALDFETDPFAPGQVVAPFCAGIFDGIEYHEFWGDDAARLLAEYLLTLPECLIYAHNGGRFDFTFLLPWIAPEVTIIGNRIVVCRIGQVELRDSFAILPVPLKTAGDKGEIDYAKMRRAVRNRHRPEILLYLKRDCLELHKAVLAYMARFGEKLTMAGAAIRELDRRVEVETGLKSRDVLRRLSMSQDADIRQFYFGGRVEAMEKGVLRGDWEVYDQNSMYPNAMSRFEHPVGNRWVEGDHIDECDFALVDATARGCFPKRAEDGGLHFPHGRCIFFVTGHEIRAARELGLCTIHAAPRTLRFWERRAFTGFVNHFYGLRMDARAAGDDTGVLHFKLVLNSSYGRFALNPDKLRDWRILPNGAGSPHEDDPARPWEPSSIGEGFTVWARPVNDMQKRRAIRNVATGASITGASRAELMRAIAKAERPIYCDTDSVICRSLDVPKGKEIGQWKLEATADESAIAGKKVYALFMEGKEVKKASKGTRLTAEEIRQVALGHPTTWYSDRPTMGLAGQQRFMHRTVRMT